jgi:hypothetical protein
MNMKKERGWEGDKKYFCNEEPQECKMKKFGLSFVNEKSFFIK